MSRPPVILWARGKRRARHGESTLFEFHGYAGAEWVAHRAIVSRRHAPAESPGGSIHPERLEVQRDWAERNVAELVAWVETRPSRRVLAPRPELVKASGTGRELVQGFVEAFDATELSLEEVAALLGYTPRQVTFLWRGWLRFADAQGLKRAVEAIEQEEQRRKPKGERR